MQSVSDDDVQKKLLKKPHFELVAKGIFRLGSYIFWQGVPGLRASNWESTATHAWSLDRWQIAYVLYRNTTTSVWIEMTIIIPRRPRLRAKPQP